MGFVACLATRVDPNNLRETALKQQKVWIDQSRVSKDLSHFNASLLGCGTAHCRRRIFTEWFGDDFVRPMARRTARLDCLVRRLALALGGRPAARFADRMGLPVSHDTPFRTVRRYDRPLIGF